jgi:hypothetical protein
MHRSLSLISDIDQLFRERDVGWMCVSGTDGAPDMRLDEIGRQGEGGVETAE